MNTDFQFTEYKLAKFWGKVDKSPGLGRDGDCWEWQAGRNPKGYGIACNNYQHTGAHRISYAIHNGNFERAKLVMHSCDNPACVNPRHLSLGTAMQNTQDMMSKGRHNESKKTHCRAGHPLAGDNLYIVNAGRSRACKTCAKARSAAKRYGITVTTADLAKIEV